MAEQRLLKTGEVAALLRVDPKTVRRWVQEGVLSPIRIGTGRHLRFWESEIDDLLKRPHG